MGEVVKFGRFALDPSAFQLRHGSRVVKLEKLAMELLLLLVARRDSLVSRDDIVEKLWGKGFHLDVENGINTAVRKVRRALGDDPENPRFIQTVPGKGYRFVAPVTMGRENPAAKRTVLAVLPFENLSQDAEQEYFCDGLTEETIANLGAVSPEQLGVIARTSSMVYRKTQKSIREIGKELGVDYILESSVRREAHRLRIVAQLIRVQDQCHVWAQSYDRDDVSLLNVQTELGRAIAAQVQAKLPPRQCARLQTEDPAAFDLYLRGRYHFARRTLEGITRAIHYYDQALQIDPRYSLAEAGLADAYATLPVTSDYRTEECLAKGVPAAERAVAGNPASAEAHTALAACKFWLTWDWRGAISEAERAISLNPSYSLAHFYLAHTQSNLGWHDDAELAIQKAKKLDPFSVHLRAIHGQLLFQAGHYPASAAAARSALALNPNAWLGHLILAKTEIEERRYDDALASLRRAFEFSGGNTEALALQAFVLAKLGRREEAGAVIAVMDETAQSRYVPFFNFALAYNGLEDYDRALTYLERAAHESDVRMMFLALDPKWSEMNRDSRVRRLWPQPQKDEFSDTVDLSRRQHAG